MPPANQSLVSRSAQQSGPGVSVRRPISGAQRTSPRPVRSCSPRHRHDKKPDQGDADWLAAGPGGAVAALRGGQGDTGGTVSRAHPAPPRYPRAGERAARPLAVPAVPAAPALRLPHPPPPPATRPAPPAMTYFRPGPAAGRSRPGLAHPLHARATPHAWPGPAPWDRTSIAAPSSATRMLICTVRPSRFTLTVRPAGGTPRSHYLDSEAPSLHLSVRTSVAIEWSAGSSGSRGSRQRAVRQAKCNTLPAPGRTRPIPIQFMSLPMRATREWSA